MKTRFLWKLYLGYVAIILLTTFVLGLLSSQHIEELSISAARETLRGKAYLVREIALPALRASLPDRALQERVRELASQVEQRVTVIREDGLVLADSWEDPSRMDNHANRPEVIGARESGEGTGIRYSTTLQTRMIYHAIAVQEGGRLLGFARMSLPVSDVDERLRRLRVQVVVGAAIVVVVALVFGFFFAQNVTRPLRRITHAARAIARGRQEEPVDVTTNDEVGQLAEAFNAMAGQLDQRVEEALRDRNKVVTILSAMVEGVVATDRRGRVLHMNEAAAQILGVSSERAEDRFLWELTDVRQVSELVKQTLEDAEERRREVQVGGGRQPRIIELHSASMRDGDGEIVGVVVILHDVTRVRQLEVMRRDFVANVSHELKTPLTAIRGLVETLEGDDMPPATRARFLEKVKNQVSRLSTLVGDLLTLARVESQRGTLSDRRRFDVRDSVLDCHRRAIVTAEERKVRIVMDMPRTAVQIFGDEEAVRQIVDNLLQNAVRYTDPGGRVDLRVLTEAEHVVIEVADTGIGIAPEHQERIFERFYRVDKARSRAEGGTGLGLSIVKHLVAGLGGTIDLESTVGEGSRFRVSIPLAAPGPR